MPTIQMIENERALNNLKKLYQVALEEKKSEFIFQESVVLVSYAKYLIQFLELKIK